MIIRLDLKSDLDFGTKICSFPVFAFCFEDVEKVFKKYDKFGSASIPKDDMKKLLQTIIPDYDIPTYDPELNELLGNYLKGNSS